MFIISLSYKVPLEQVDRFIPEHIEYLDTQYDHGHFILSGRKEPRTGGIIIATLSNRAELDKIISLDPFYREGLASYEITEIIPTKATEALRFLI
ncbi:YciI family protein [Vibrio profundi]|uniref:YciI family protein n=1 Tax=Vibrio profundi TaxID=1774960 RepID=UPI0037357E25